MEVLRQEACSCSVGFRPTLITVHQIRDFGVGLEPQLKNISQIVHSRHRSVKNFMVNVLAGLIAYTFQEKKPSLKLDKNEVEKLPALLA